MSQPTRMKTTDFFRVAESVYGWELTPGERDILYNLAKKAGGSIVLDNWELFQGRFPGHPAWEFHTWYEDILGGVEEDRDGAYEDSVRITKG